jgi:hypothetical protein
MEREESCRNGVWHVYPIDDREPHVLDGTKCKCIPTAVVEEDGGVLVRHNSFDGRELSGREWNERMN